VLKLGLGCVPKTAQQLSREFFWALGENMGRKPKSVTEEAEGSGRREVQKLKV
jgi:hypothetical protein